MVEISSEFKNKSVVNPDAPDCAKDMAKCRDPMMRACNNGYSYAAGDLRTDRMDSMPGASAGIDLFKEIAKIDAMWVDEIQELESMVGQTSDEKQDKYRSALRQAKSFLVDNTHAKLVACVKADGFFDAGKSVQSQPGCYRVGVVCFSEEPTKEKLRYRFVREDSDGGWSYMNDDGAVKRTDRYDAPISMPHMADWGENASFVGYMYAPKGGVRVAGKPVGLVVMPGQNAPHLKK